jgi:hypothetical protein
MGLQKTDSVNLTAHLVSDCRVTPTTSGEIPSHFGDAQHAQVQDIESNASPDSSQVSVKRKGLKVAFKVSEPATPLGLLHVIL